MSNNEAEGLCRDWCRCAPFGDNRRQLVYNDPVAIIDFEALTNGR